MAIVAWHWRSAIRAEGQHDLSLDCFGMESYLALILYLVITIIILQPPRFIALLNIMCMKSIMVYLCLQ